MVHTLPLRMHAVRGDAPNGPGDVGGERGENDRHNRWVEQLGQRGTHKGELQQRGHQREEYGAKDHLYGARAAFKDARKMACAPIKMEGDVEVQNV